jgi:uncharacterized protein YlxW (UPF0749 family)
VLVTALAGLLFATSARLLKGSDSPADLRGLVREQDAKVATLQTEADSLAAQVDALTGGASVSHTTSDEALDIASGVIPVAGPGVRVTLDDAPAAADQGDQAVQAPLDALVVHQQDIEAVLNTLWRAGAQAVAIQGVRLTALDGVRCVGNVLLLAGRTYSPPYVIEAIGPAADLARALETSSLLAAYRQAAADLDLGWQIRTSRRLSLPAAAGGSIGLQYVSVNEATRGPGRSEGTE